VRAVVGCLLALAAVVGVILGSPDALLGALAAAVMAALVVDRRLLPAVLRVGVFLALLISSAMVGGVVAWSSDWVSGREIATAMFLRLLVFVILAALLARNVDAEALLRGTRRLGMERLGLILGLALNVLPRLGEATRQVILAWRVRRRSKAGRAPSPLALLEVLLAHVARIADDAAAAAALRGHAALLQRPVLAAGATPVIVATGATGAGKTTAVLSTVEDLRRSGYRVAGFVQPPRLEDGRKIGFGVRDLLSGEETDFARLVSRSEGEHDTRFRFESAGFGLAERALGEVRSGDLLVIDELGPLELRGEGHMRAVQRALDVPGLRAVVVVVRGHLVPALLAALEIDDATVVDVTADGGEQALTAAIERAAGTESPSAVDSS
jgi:nucleoside-triphosphatase THEP1/energy-coupling factor transporter transmembrane protein EcfT